MKKELIIVIIIVIAIIIIDTITQNYTRDSFEKINNELEKIKEIINKIDDQEKNSQQELQETGK